MNRTLKREPKKIQQLTTTKPIMTKFLHAKATMNRHDCRRSYHHFPQQTQDFGGRPYWISKKC